MAREPWTSRFCLQSFVQGSTYAPFQVGFVSEKYTNTSNPLIKIILNLRIHASDILSLYEREITS